MDQDTGSRLRAAAETCIAAFEKWQNNRKDLTAREGLVEAIHDMRKVTSRVEIEMAVSERDTAVARPLPIPPHRASRPRVGDAHDKVENADHAEDIGQNMMAVSSPKPPRRRVPITSVKQSETDNGA